MEKGKAFLLCMAAVAIVMLSAALPQKAFPASTTEVHRILQEAKEDPSLKMPDVVRKFEPAGLDTIAALRLSLFHDDPFFRARSAEVLALLGDQGAGSVARLLKDESTMVREAASRALIVMGSSSVDYVAQVLKKEPPASEAFKRSLEILGAIGDSAGIPHICSALVQHRNGRLRLMRAYDAIRDIGPSSAAPLVDLLEHKSLQEDVLLTLLAFEKDALARALAAAADDSSLPAVKRLELAETADYILGSEAVIAVLEPILLEIERDESQPAYILEWSAELQVRMLSSPTQPLTAEEVQATYRAIARRESREERQDRDRKVLELKRRRAIMAEVWEREIKNHPGEYALRRLGSGYKKGRERDPHLTKIEDYSSQTPYNSYRYQGLGGSLRDIDGPTRRDTIRP